MKSVRQGENCCTALILSDSGNLRGLVSGFLLESEAPVGEILCASNDGEARYFLRHRSIDLVIADHAPDWECEAPVLVIGPPVVERIQESLDLGAAGYLVKPFSCQSLVREVDYALQSVAVVA